MNIFVLDNNPITAAQYHNNKHVVKMILEAAQMLSTAHRILDGEEYTDKSRSGRNIKRWKLEENNDLIYKAVHVNHPCTIWTRESLENYQWHYDLFVALCDEYTYRYGKVHETDTKLRDVLKHPPKNIETTKGLTPFAQAMPDYCKNPDGVTAYRNYYIHEKTELCVWKQRAIPEWFNVTNGVGVFNANL